MFPLLACGLCLGGEATAEEKTTSTASLTIEAGTPAGKVSPMHYGLITEEINYCYDGGLYAELVRNRAFLDDPQKPTHWSAVQAATITLDPQQPLNESISTSLRLDVATASATTPDSTRRRPRDSTARSPSPSPARTVRSSTPKPKSRNSPPIGNSTMSS